MTVADMADGMANYRHNATRIKGARIGADNLRQLAQRCGGRVGLAWPRFWQPVLIVPTLHHGRRRGPIGWFLVERYHPHEFYPVTAEVFAIEYSAETNGD